MREPHSPFVQYSVVIVDAVTESLLNGHSLRHPKLRTLEGRRVQEQELLGTRFAQAFYAGKVAVEDLFVQRGLVCGRLRVCDVVDADEEGHQGV